MTEFVLTKREEMIIDRLTLKRRIKDDSSIVTADPSPGVSPLQSKENTRKGVLIHTHNVYTVYR